VRSCVYGGTFLFYIFMLCRDFSDKNLTHLPRPKFWKLCCLIIIYCLFIIIYYLFSYHNAPNNLTQG
jgi:hypothetical protein